MIGAALLLRKLNAKSFARIAAIIVTVRTRKSDTVVVNFYGGPGAGKSTLAAQLFGWMKQERMNVEYAPEYAKDLCWEGASPDDQIHIFGEQHRRLYRLLDKTDYIITDSPLLFSLIYLPEGMKKYSLDGPWGPWRDAFDKLVFNTYQMYHNVDFEVIRGNRKFIQAGRYHDETQSRQLDQEITTMLDYYQIPRIKVQTLEEVIGHL